MHVMSTCIFSSLRANEYLLSIQNIVVNNKRCSDIHLLDGARCALNLSVYLRNKDEIFRPIRADFLLLVLHSVDNAVKRRICYIKRRHSPQLL